MSGAITGPFLIDPGPGNVLCASPLADDPHSVNYVFEGNVESARPDIGVGVNFAVHSYSKPGKFSVGAYPAGSPASPGIASVVKEITPKQIVTWISGSGEVIIDPRAHSGTVNLHLASTSGLDDLLIVGSWAC